MKPLRRSSVRAVALHALHACVLLHVSLLTSQKLHASSIHVSASSARAARRAPEVHDS